MTIFLLNEDFIVMDGKNKEFLSFIILKKNVVTTYYFGH
jgi:hypothetical protein